MIRNRTNKIIWVMLVVLCLVASSEVFAEPVSVDQVREAAGTFLQAQGYGQHAALRSLGKGKVALEATQTTIPTGYTLAQTKEILGDDGTILAHVTELDPEGFIITAADNSIRPILGYSFKGRFPFEDSKDNVLLHLVQWDVEARLKALSSNANEAKAVAQSNNELWESYALSDGSLVQTLASATEWGPWITTNWYQSGRYNNKCPYQVPYVPGVRRPVGCVATAMAQIINYWEFPSSVPFSSADSYSENGISFDADASKYGFPTFTELNSELAIINYDDDDEEVAYLNFGAGVKLEMSYGAFGSGSGASTHSAGSVLRNDFSYGSAIAKSNMSGIWSQYRSNAIENIKTGWPLQIAIHKSGQSGGHSVIVDGYRDSDDFFHVNFGWGGTGTTWYDLPDSYGSYDVVHTVVSDICPTKGWSQWKSDAENSARTVYAAPTSSNIKDKWLVSCSSDYYFTGMVIGEGGKIYACSSPRHGDQGYPSEVWVIPWDGDIDEINKIVLHNEEGGIQYPAQNSKGEVFVASDDGRVYRVDTRNDSASLIFTDPYGQQVHEPLKVDEGDYLYAMTFDRLYCLTGTGNEVWSTPFNPPGSGQMYYAPAIDFARGRVYVPYYDVDLDTAYLAMLDRESGQVILTKSESDITFASYGIKTPSIGEDGTVYVQCYTTLYALDPENFLTLKASRDLYPSLLSHRAIGRNGRIYQPYWKDPGGGGAWTYNVGALEPDYGSGTFDIIWEMPFSIGLSDNIGEVHVAANGVVVFNIQYENDSDPDTHVVYAIKDNGSTYEQLWMRDFGTSGGNLAFGPNRTVFVMPSSGYGHSITAIADPETLGMGWQDNAAPDIPSNPSPTDGEPNLDPNVLLSWDCSDPENHDIKYSLFIRESGYEDMVPVATDINETSYLLEGLNPGTGYAWTVIATDGQAVTEGPTWVFSTEEPAVTSIEISGPNQVQENSGAQYTCTAHYDDDSMEDVTNDANWTENSDYASIDSNGYLTTSSVSSDQPCQITATYGAESDTHDMIIKNTIVIVPDVTGMTQADAEAAITTAGLIVGTVTTPCDNTVAAGNVISQDPNAGSSVAPDTMVGLVVSTGPCPPPVPVPIKPYDNEIIDTNTPTFEWTAFYAGDSGATQAGYQVRVWCDTNFVEGPVYDTGLVESTDANSHIYNPDPNAYSGDDKIADCARASKPLEPSRHYHWHVRYYDSLGNWTDWSANEGRATHQDFYKGPPLEASVYRFWSPTKERHFYTINESEKDKLIDNYPHVWTYEGIAYYAFETDSEPGLVPVYRFWSPVLSAHFYTIDEAERDKLIDNYPHVWTYEGIAFYAYFMPIQVYTYPDGQQPDDAMPIYRFWSDSLETHFYTMDETEKNKLIEDYSHVWTYEGIAGYAYE